MVSAERNVACAHAAGRGRTPCLPMRVTSRQKHTDMYTEAVTTRTVQLKKDIERSRGYIGPEHEACLL